MPSLRQTLEAHHKHWFLKAIFTVNYHHTFHQSGSRQENLKFVIQNILMLWNRSCCKSTVKENPQVSWHFRKTKELYFTLSQGSFAPARRVFETDIPARVQYVLFFEIFVSLMLSLSDVKKNYNSKKYTNSREWQGHHHSCRPFTVGMLSPEIKNCLFVWWTKCTRNLSGLICVPVHHSKLHSQGIMLREITDNI